MIEDGRYCPDILIQLRAARSALKTIEGNILETHLSHCVQDAMRNGSKKAREKKLEEIKQLFKRFED